MSSNLQYEQSLASPEVIKKQAIPETDKKLEQMENDLEKEDETPIESMD